MDRDISWRDVRRNSVRRKSREFQMTIQIDIEAERELLHQNYILVLTTNTKEQKAVRRQLMGVRDVRGRFEALGCDIGLLRGQFVVVARGNSGTQGDQTISTIATAFLSRPTMPQPRLIAIVGLAGEIPETLNAVMWSQRQRFGPSIG